MVLAFVIGGFSGEKSPLGEAGQWAPLLVLAAIAMWTVTRGASYRLDAANRQAVVVGVAICASSMIGAFIASDEASAIYTVLMLLVWLVIALMGGRISLDRMLASFALAAIILVWSFLALSYDDFLVRLQLSAVGLAPESRYGGPFEIHPNLLGHIMGASAGVMFWYATSVYGLRRWFTIVSCGVALAMCLAASSRGGLVASTAAVGVTYLLTAIEDRRRRTHVVIAIFAIAGAVLIFVPETLDALSNMLDLTSKDRGLADSGLSGRTELWDAAIARFGSISAPIVWGGGFRNRWLNENIVDNSYIVILMETGAVGLVLWIGRILQILKRSISSIFRAARPVDLAVTSHLLFSLAEGVVNRQLLAIGNPASLLTIMIVILYVPIRARSDEARPIDSQSR
ncbi:MULTISPECIES: O-antigen ligase family protein [Ramlibacter]|uniref:O-antigen ligase family protein n=1 Tax=Ramlibacter TaxID=174951 RepID=UPI0012FCE750|nr:MULTISPECIES: O-antigen ligase family protein [Ramlibacter]MBA2964811.1 O-antigen ligase family protein [Ramlibacter sp. CGMCC 1.13660]